MISSTHSCRVRDTFQRIARKMIALQSFLIKLTQLTVVQNPIYRAKAIQFKLIQLGENYVR